jgi:hypothetical protein
MGSGAPEYRCEAEIGTKGGGLWPIAVPAIISNYSVLVMIKITLPETVSPMLYGTQVERVRG